MVHVPAQGWFLQLSRREGGCRQAPGANFFAGRGLEPAGTMHYSINICKSLQETQWYRGHIWPGPPGDLGLRGRVVVVVRQ